MGQALPSRRLGWLAGPQLASGSPASADSPGHRRPHRGAAPSAPDRQGDRHRNRRFDDHRQPRPQTPGPQSPERPRASHAAAPLSARATWRTDPHRHQKARQVQPHRPSHHRRPHRPEQHPRRRLGVRSRRHRRRLAHCLYQGHEDRAPDLRRHLLKLAVAYYASLGITVERVMTDNGSCYRSRRFRSLCSRLGIKLIYTRPYTPKTNGKAERFIQTALREWAYAKAYDTSQQRAAELPYWLHRYNWHRPHGSIGAVPPISTLGLTGNNLLRLHS